jgi:hypothetical protein
VGIKKSSRVNAMNLYDYRLIRENMYIKIIDLSNNLSEVWNIQTEINNINFMNNGENFPTKHYMESFSRCRRWLLENHSELML